MECSLPISLVRLRALYTSLSHPLCLDSINGSSKGMFGCHKNCKLDHLQLSHFRMDSIEHVWLRGDRDRFLLVFLKF